MSTSAPRILIVRLSALGDAALTLPLLFTLRKRIPHAYIGWVVEDKAASLLDDFPGLDKMHVWRKADKNPLGAWKLSREIAAEKYDISLDAQGLSKSAILPWLAGIKKRVGFARRPLEAREISPVLNNIRITPPENITHIALRTNYLAKGIGLEPPFGLSQQLPVHPTDLKYIRGWWEDNGLGKKVIVFGVGTSWITKIWPVEHMAHVVRVAQEKGYTAVVTWGPDEKDKLDGWREYLGDEVVWSPQTASVGELIALLSMAERYAGPDSAPLHLSWLLGKPTFSWFGPSDSLRGAPPSSRDRHVVAFSPTRERKGDMLWCLKPETVLPEFSAWLDL